MVAIGAVSHHEARAIECPAMDDRRSSGTVTGYLHVHATVLLHHYTTLAVDHKVTIGHIDPVGLESTMQKNAGETIGLHSSGKFVRTIKKQFALYRYASVYFTELLVYSFCREKITTRRQPIQSYNFDATLLADMWSPETVYEFIVLYG